MHKLTIKSFGLMRMSSSSSSSSSSSLSPDDLKSESFYDMEWWDETAFDFLLSSADDAEGLLLFFLMTEAFWTLLSDDYFEEIEPLSLSTTYGCLFWLARSAGSMPLLLPWREDCLDARELPVILRTRGSTI